MLLLMLCDPVVFLLICCCYIFVVGDFTRHPIFLSRQFGSSVDNRSDHEFESRLGMRYTRYVGSLLFLFFGSVCFYVFVFILDVNKSRLV